MVETKQSSAPSSLSYKKIGSNHHGDRKKTVLFISRFSWTLGKKEYISIWK